MYGGFEVFKAYLAIKLHFTTDTYNYDEYGGKVNCKLETFTKRNDRYFFINYQNNMMKKILLTSLLLTLHITTKNG